MVHLHLTSIIIGLNRSHRRVGSVLLCIIIIIIIVVIVRHCTPALSSLSLHIVRLQQQQHKYLSLVQNTRMVLLPHCFHPEN
jgi:hypothetical protein